MLAKRLTRRGVGLTAVVVAGLIVEAAQAVTCVPPGLHTIVVKAGCGLAFGEVAVHGVSTQALALFSGTLRSLAFSKLRLAAGCALVACTLVAAAGWLVNARQHMGRDQEAVNTSFDVE